MVETEDKPSGGSGCGVIIALGVLTIGILLWMLASSSVSSLARPPVADSETFEGTVFLTRERRVLTLRSLNRRASDGDDDDRGCGETTGVETVCGEEPSS